MAVLRVLKRDNPFVQIDKTSLNDTSLSWQAKGLLAYLLSKPDDWTVNVKHIVKQSTNGRDAVYTIIKDLIEHGYIRRTEVRDDNGKIARYMYDVFEVPLPDFPYTDKPDTENQYINNKEDTKNDFSNNIINDEEEKPKNIFTLYQDNISPTYGSLLADELADFESVHSYEHLEQAFKIAVDKNVRNWSYVRRILTNWEEKGYDYTPNKEKETKTLSEMEVFIENAKLDYPNKPIEFYERLWKAEVEYLNENSRV